MKQMLKKIALASLLSIPAVPVIIGAATIDILLSPVTIPLVLKRERYYSKIIRDYILSLDQITQDKIGEFLNIKNIKRLTHSTLCKAMIAYKMLLPPFVTRSLIWHNTLPKHEVIAQLQELISFIKQI